MSRAFVKESDVPADDLGDLPLSPHPNYSTPRGLRRQRARQAQIRQRLALIADDPLHGAERSDLQREARWLQARIGAAIEVDSRARPSAPERVGFGSVVEVVDVHSGAEHRYQIVGEDEAAPAQGRLSWISPLARALEGAVPGDIVLWPRPVGDCEVQVLGIGCDPAPDSD